MAKEIVHEDFGEKIGGAKKDLWAARGLYVDDLLGMNEREADKYVKKDNVWKKPDYNALIQSGVPVDILYFRKVVRDSLNASPRYLRSDDTPEKRLARQKEYIATVRQVQEAVEKVQTVQEAMGVFEALIIGGGYCERISHGIGGGYIRATQKGRDNPVITDKLVNALYFRGTQDFDRKIVREAVKKQFGVPAEQKVPRGYDIRFNDGKRTYSKNNDWLPDTYYVTKGYTILKTNFATREEALKWVQDLARQRGASGKQRFVPQQLSRVRRTGPDYRGKRDVIGQDYLDAFAFRGGEFGNWMTQNDRRASLNMGFDALKDLAAVLQISEKDISYQGTLSIAFGARGSGNAAAHYEPLRKVINLTKMHGAGSLAHEWWHGLDDYLGVKMGAKGFLSEHSRFVTSHLYEKPVDSFAKQREDQRNRFSAPIPNAPENCFYYRQQWNPNHESFAGCINEELNLAVMVCSDPNELPLLCNWQSRAAGDYAMGIEPCTCYGDGRENHLKRGQLITLEPYEEKAHHLTVRFLTLDTDTQWIKANCELTKPD